MTRTTTRSRRRHRRCYEHRAHHLAPTPTRHAFRDLEQEVDCQIASRLRRARRARRMAQADLAGELGITYQQVQKYERAVNRVSASRLVMIADVLEVPVAYFLDDFPPPHALSGGRCASCSC